MLLVTFRIHSRAVWDLVSVGKKSACTFKKAVEFFVLLVEYLQYSVIFWLFIFKSIVLQILINFLFIYSEPSAQCPCWITRQQSCLYDTMKQKSFHQWLYVGNIQDGIQKEKWQSLDPRRADPYVAPKCKTVFFEKPLYNCIGHKCNAFWSLGALKRVCFSKLSHFHFSRGILFVVTPYTIP